MKKTKLKKSQVKLELHRETLRTLVPDEAALAAAGATSACRSGATCCHATCNCP